MPPVGALKASGNPFEPYWLVDGAGETITPAAAFFAELVACGRPATTLRSYGMDLLRWFRFLAAVGMVWDQATQVEARDFCRWLQLAPRPVRPHWRYPDGGGPGSAAMPGTVRGGSGPGTAPNGERYAAVTVAHCESVLRGFYDFHLEAGTGPMLNPFPLARARGGSRAGAHQTRIHLSSSVVAGIGPRS